LEKTATCSAYAILLRLGLISLTLALDLDAYHTFLLLQAPESCRYERINPRLPARVLRANEFSEERNGQSGLSAWEVCADALAAVIIPAVRASMTSAVILLLEPIVLFLLC
jgi:hypothetical protein